MPGGGDPSQGWCPGSHLLQGRLRLVEQTEWPQVQDILEGFMTQSRLGGGAPGEMPTTQNTALAHLDSPVHRDLEGSSAHVSSKAFLHRWGN